MSVHTKIHLSKIISWRCNWVNQFQIEWLHKIKGAPETLFYKKISRAKNPPASHVFLPQFSFFCHLPVFWKSADFYLIFIKFN